MNNKLTSHTLSTLRIIAISSLTIFTLYTLQAWTGPIQSAPNGNVGGPLTTNDVTQVKSGSLGVLDNFSIGKDLIVNGKVGIGTATLLNTLDVNGNATTTPFQIKGGGNVGVEVFRFYTADGIEKMRMRDNGNVGIGTMVPAQKLSVAGTIESTSGGIKFPDGTVQTTAAAGGGTGISAILKPWLAGKSISCPFGIGGTVYAKVDANGNPYTRVYYNGNDSGWVYGFSASISAYSASWSFGSRPSLSGTLSGTPFSCQGVDWPLN